MSADNRGIKAENKVIKPEWWQRPGEVLITCCWPSVSPVGEAQDGAGCTQAQGHFVPLFVLPLRKPTPRLSLPSPHAVLRLPSLPVPFAIYLFILCSVISLLPFHQQYKQYLSSTVNLFVLSGNQAFPVPTSPDVTECCSRVRERGGGPLLHCACDSNKDVRDPAAEATLILPSCSSIPTLSPTETAGWHLSACISRYSDTCETETRIDQGFSPEL